jgi:hypothetical protein
MMYSINDPDEMKPAERILEVACILTKGFLRIRKPDLLSTSIDANDVYKLEHSISLKVSERYDNSETNTQRRISVKKL